MQNVLGATPETVRNREGTSPPTPTIHEQRESARIVVLQMYDAIKFFESAVEFPVEEVGRRANESFVNDELLSLWADMNRNHLLAKISMCFVSGTLEKYDQDTVGESRNSMVRYVRLKSNKRCGRPLHLRATLTIRCHGDIAVKV